MKMPSVKTEVIDRSTNVKYEILAYRKLSESEARSAIAYYRSQHKRKPKAGSKITIISAIE